MADSTTFNVSVFNLEHTEVLLIYREYPDSSTRSFANGLNEVQIKAFKYAIAMYESDQSDKGLSALQDAFLDNEYDIAVR